MTKSPTIPRGKDDLASDEIVEPALVVRGNDEADALGAPLGALALALGGAQDAGTRRRTAAGGPRGEARLLLALELLVRAEAGIRLPLARRAAPPARGRARRARTAGTARTLRPAPGPSSHARPSQARSSRSPASSSRSDRSTSVSSMRRMKRPPSCRAKSQLKSAVRAPPTWRCPVGLGANRTRTLSRRKTLLPRRPAGASFDLFEKHDRLGRDRALFADGPEPLSPRRLDRDVPARRRRAPRRSPAPSPSRYGASLGSSAFTMQSAFTRR